MDTMFYVCSCTYGQIHENISSSEKKFNGRTRMICKKNRSRKRLPNPPPSHRIRNRFISRIKSSLEPTAQLDLMLLAVVKQINDFISGFVHWLFGEYVNAVSGGFTDDRVVGEGGCAHDDSVDSSGLGSSVVFVCCREALECIGLVT
jgi:hypothetical protein